MANQEKEYSISIYRDKKNTILIIPDSFDENGVRRELNKPKIIEMPYDLESIGSNVKDCFYICVNNSFQSQKSAVKVYEIATGVKSWSKFFKDRISVWGELDLKKGYNFAPFKKSQNSSYAPFSNDISFKVNLDADYKTIGEAVLKAFDYITNNS